MLKALALVGLLSLLALGSDGDAEKQAPVEAGFPSSPQAVKPLAVGARAPQVTLTMIDGKPVELAPLIARQPVVLIFYRGGW